MIREYSEKDQGLLKNLIKNDMLQNVYLYIDVQVYGFSGESINTLLAEEKGEIVAVIYFYHSSIQLFEINGVSDAIAKEIADIIFAKRIKRVSGKVNLIKQIASHIEADYVETDGHIMKYESNKQLPAESVCFATLPDFNEIAMLIYNDSHLGFGYEYEDLLSQLKSRYLYDGCENVYIKKDGSIVSHFATYAVTDELAVLSGAVTHPDYRGMGYGSTLVKFLSEHIAGCGKSAIIYCYQDEYYTWYQKLGYSGIETSAKLDIQYTEAFKPESDFGTKIFRRASLKYS